MAPVLVLGLMAMSDTTTLTDLLGKRVTITNPRCDGASWTGRIIALHDDPGVVIEQDDGLRVCLPQEFDVTEASSPDPTAADAITSPGSIPAAGAAPAGRLARVEVKGFRDLGIVRVTETTLAGEAMLHAEKDDGSSADFPASSLHFITWLPEGAIQAPAMAAIPASFGHHGEGDYDELNPF